MPHGMYIVHCTVHSSKFCNSHMSTHVVMIFRFEKKNEIQNLQPHPVLHKIVRVTTIFVSRFMWKIICNRICFDWGCTVFMRVLSFNFTFESWCGKEHSTQAWHRLLGLKNLIETIAWSYGNLYVDVDVDGGYGGGNHNEYAEIVCYSILSTDLNSYFFALNWDDFFLHVGSGSGSGNISNDLLVQMLQLVHFFFPSSQYQFLLFQSNKAILMPFFNHFYHSNSTSCRENIFFFHNDNHNESDRYVNLV